VWSFVSPAHAADPTTVDCLSANERSIKARTENRLRDARAELLTCAAESCPADIRNECARRVSEVNASMPTIVFEAKDAAGNDVSAVKVFMDDQLLIERLQGSALSIDPGPHKFRFEAAGVEPIEKQYVIAQGQKDRRELVVLGAALALAGAGATATTPAGADQAPASAAGDPGATQRILGWTAIGAGAVGVTLGIVFSIQRGSKISDREAICAEGAPCPPGSQASVDALTDEARTAGTLAAVGFIAGGALAAGGVALLLTAPKAQSSMSLIPVVSPAFAGLTLRGCAF
jgi:hypothetical protein